MPLRVTEANLAAIPEVRAFVEDNVIPQFALTRDNRAAQDRRIARYYRIWGARLDKASYVGRTKLYVAAGRRVIETIAKQLKTGFFASSGEWHSVLPVEGVTTEEMAAAMHALQRHWFTKTMRLKTQFMPWARQLCITGTSPFQQGWSSVERTVKALRRQADREGALKLKLVTDTLKTAGPTFRPISYFDWFVYPETIAEVDDAQCVWEDREVSKALLRRRGETLLDDQEPRRGYYYENVDEASSIDTLPAGYKEHRADRLRALGITYDPSERWQGIDRKNVVLQQAFWTGEIPGARDPVTGDDLDGERRWLITTVGDTIAVRVQINPFYRQRPTYDAVRIIRMLDEFYGHSPCEAFDRVQYFLNDVINQTGDGLQMSLNGVAIVDPTRHTRPKSMRWAPRAIWYAPPDGVRFDRPADVTPAGLQAASFLQGVLHDHGGVPAILQGQPPARGQGRVAQSSSGLNLLATTGSGDIQDALEEFDEAAERMMERNAELAEQFMTDDIVLKTIGRLGGPWIRRRIGIGDVLGEYVYQWRGSLATRQSAQLAQGMTRFMEMAVRIPPQPGVHIRFDRMLKRIWSDVFMRHDADEIVTTWEDQLVVDPYVEHDLIDQMRPIQVQPAENLLQHLKVHVEMGLPRFQNEPQKAAILAEHVEKTFAAMQAQAAQMQQMAMMAAAQAGGGVPPGMPRPGGPPPGLQGRGSLPPAPPAGGNPGDLARQLQ